MKFIAKLLFKESIDRYSKIAVHYIEKTCLELKGSQKKAKAIELVVKRISIPLFLRKIPFVYNFLYRHLTQIQALVECILSEEIDLFIENHVRELNNESV